MSIGSVCDGAVNGDPYYTPQPPLRPFDRARQEFLAQFREWLDNATPDDALDEFKSTVGAMTGLLQVRFMV